MDINGRNMKDYITNVKQQNASNFNKQDAILVSINDRLEDTNRLINSGNSVTAKIADALRLDWLRQLGTELKGYMRRIIAMNVATYHAVISIQSALPSRLERGLIEEPFILEDAIGRIAPVHLQFVTSWDAFNAVLEIRFREIQGFHKIKRKQYGLQDKATKRDIEQSRPWQRAFLPGQRIEMSFLFDTPEKEGSMSDVTCPGCQITSTYPTDAEVHCGNCGMWFRRITIVQDVEPQPQVPVPSPWRSRSEFGKPGFTGMVSGPVRPGKKRVAPADLDGDDDPREFKRVRLVIRKERTRLQAFEERKGTQIFKTFSTLSSIARSEPSTKTWTFHHRQHMQSSQVKDLDSTDEYGIPKSPATDQPLDLVEIVKEELSKAREAGLLSKKKPGTGSNQDDNTESYVTKMENDREREIFWDPKWFPQQVSDPVTIKDQRTSAPWEQYTPYHEDDTRDEALVRSREQWLPSPDSEIEFSINRAFVEYVYFSSPILQKYIQPFHHLDPATLHIEQLIMAKDSMDGRPWPFSNQSHNTLWPIRSLTAYVSATRAVSSEELDYSLIATADALYGTPFRLPRTDTVFYGASIGRWIFDWTCHLFFKGALVCTALQFWNSIYTLERNLFILVHSQYGWNSNESGGIWDISEEANMNFNHFIVCYRCFWWQLLSSMTTIPMPNGQGFNGITPPTVEAYANVFLKIFFFLTPWGIEGRYKKASRLLDYCSMYLEAGIGEIEDFREQEAGSRKRRTRKKAAKKSK
jgi:hypothetical protein